MREITADAIDDLATGAAILGTGGGGDPHVGKLMAQSAIAEHGPVALLDPADLPSDALVIPTAGMGAPTVLIEKLPSGSEPIAALRRVAAEFDRDVFATMPIECGGINSTIPFAVAAREGLPVVDADGMGRAFPEFTTRRSTSTAFRDHRPVSPMSTAIRHLLRLPTTGHSRRWRVRSRSRWVDRRTSPIIR